MSLIDDYDYLQENYQNIFDNLDYQFKHWQIMEKENKIYQQYISNSERAIVPYYNVINVLSLCINIVYMCIINFIVVPGIFVDVTDID